MEGVQNHLWFELNVNNVNAVYVKRIKQKIEVTLFTLEVLGGFERILFCVWANIY